MTIRFNGVRVKPSEAINSATYIDPIGDSKVAMLLHMEGANNSTTFTDKSYSPLVVTAGGNAKISTSASKFGGSSASFDGSNSYLSFTKSPEFIFGSDDFTIEGWVNFNSLATYQSIYGQYDIGLDFVNSTTMVIGYNATPGGFAFTVPTMSTGTWYHFAIVRSSGFIRFYWNGTQSGSAFSAPGMNNSYNTVVIGKNGPAQNYYYFDGYLDEFRVSKGIARYTSNFTPSATAFPNADGSVELPSTASVGEAVYSSDAAYICTSASPVTWKQFSQTGNNVTP